MISNGEVKSSKFCGISFEDYHSNFFLIELLILREKQANRNPEQTCMGSKSLATRRHLSGFIWCIESMLLEYFQVLDVSW